MKKNLLTLFILFFILQLATGQNQKELILNFGIENTRTPGIPIDSLLRLGKDNSYGFDFGTSENVQLQMQSFTSEEPVYFSINIPEGNYKIKVVLGSEKKTSETTIKAESKRIFRDRIQVKKGEKKTETFTVNIRNPKIKNGGTVSLKNRELDDLDWDNKLTLEFLGDVAVQKICISPENKVKTIYLAGDSTMTDQDLEPWASWGQLITQYFNNSVAIANHAFSGASLASFKGRKRLEKIKKQIKSGDYLVIGFAHNDEKRTGEGIGPWESYTELLREFVLGARNKGAKPILVTPTQRRFFNENGQLTPTHGNYPAAIRKVAHDMEVPLVDLTEMTTKMYESWGREQSKKAFVHYPPNTFPGQTKELKDNTHFNNFGANEVALSFIQGLREKNLSFSKYLNKDTPKYNPENPNKPSSWEVPLSSRFENTKPDGN